MKNVNALLVLVLIFVGSVTANAQWSTGADLYSSYVWRGVQYGGPSVQPYVDYTKGGFSVGAWGSAGFDGTMEMDLYASYGFDFGLSIGATDYYYPGTEYFDLSDSTGAHGFELNLGYELEGLSLSANYMLNEAGGAGTVGGDMYFELGYSFESLDLFVGAGDGWHTPDGEFGVVNVGIGTSKEIPITEKFSLPVSGSVILNPTTEQFFIVVGISL
ncbi:MAG: hypothetical protein K9G70_02460 [Prolixibacteraceae bacterium]|nr:hypothetical protein [Prolixibacteraceae bacterium]